MPIPEGPRDLQPPAVVQAGILRMTLALVALSTTLQAMALLGLLPIAPGSRGWHLYGVVELLLVAGLLCQGWRIRRWSVATGQSAAVQQMAHLCLYSLLLCGLGDVVNRNFLARYHPWDDVIKHGYLVESIVFFFPAYALVVVANWRLAARHIQPAVRRLTVLVAALVGVFAYLGSHDPRVNAVAAGAMLVYTVLHALMVLSAVWLVRAHGWRVSRWVVSGVLLAAVADALIGQFWIFSDHFPVIEHVNWVIYFASLALIQQLPFLAARLPQAAGVPDALRR